MLQNIRQIISRLPRYLADFHDIRQITMIFAPSRLLNRNRRLLHRSSSLALSYPCFLTQDWKYSDSNLWPPGNISFSCSIWALADSQLIYPDCSFYQVYGMNSYHLATSLSERSQHGLSLPDVGRGLRVVFHLQEKTLEFYVVFDKIKIKNICARSWKVMFHCLAERVFFVFQM